MKASDFLPEIPKPEELKPFPTYLNTEFGQVDIERAGGVVGLAMSPDGCVLVVCHVRAAAFFDSKTTKCIYTIWLDDSVEFFGVDVSNSGIAGLIKTDGIMLINLHADRREIPQIEVGMMAAKSSDVFVWNYERDDGMLQK